MYDINSIEMLLTSCWAGSLSVIVPRACLLLVARTAGGLANLSRKYGGTVARDTLFDGVLKEEKDCFTSVAGGSLLFCNGSLTSGCTN